MSTELSQQIARLREQHVQAAGPIHQGRASLFLSPKEAAAVDVEQVYDAAINGLITLAQYDSRISKFRDDILHPSSISVQREMKTPEENKALDREISSLLEYLSIFANEQAAHSVIEYLIRRYRVHELNADALIKCLLPLHDTKIFARAVQLCAIEGTIWAFLDGVKISGSPLPRTSIVHRCRKDTSVLTAVLQITRTAVSLASDTSVRARSAVSAGADRILSFFTAVVVELSETGSLSDAQLRALYPFLMEGLKLKGSTTNDAGDSHAATLAVIMGGGIVNEWRRVSCMIVAQISRKTKLAAPLLKNFVGALVGAFTRVSIVASDSLAAPPLRSGVDLAYDACMEILIALAVLAQQQSVALGAVVLRAAFADADAHGTIGDDDKESIVRSSLLTSLEILQSKGFDASALVRALAVGLVSALLYPYSESKSSRRPLSFKSDLAAKLICYSVAKGSFSHSVIALILSKILESVSNASTKASAADGDDGDDDEERVSARSECLRVLRSVSQRHPDVFDVCVQAAYRHASSGEGAGVRGIDDDEDDDDSNSDNDESKVGAANSDSALTVSLKNLLEEAFTAAPYRMPSDSGVSLFLALEDASTNVRTQALASFSASVPVGCDSTEDVVGLAYSAMKALTDEDYTVASAAWNSDVVSRIVEHVSASEFLATTVAAFSWWSEYYSRVPKRGAKLIAAILTTLSTESIAKVICADDAETADVAGDAVVSGRVSGRVWLFVTLVHCASGAFSVADDSASAADETKSSGKSKTPKKSKKSTGVVESVALSCAVAVKGFIPLFSAVKIRDDDKSSILSIAQSASSRLKKDLKAAYRGLIEAAKHAFELLDTTTTSATTSTDASQVATASASKAKAVSFALFLDSTISQLTAVTEGGGGGGGEGVTAALQGCVAILTSLLIRFVTIADSRGEKVPHEVIEVLRNLIKNSSSASFVSPEEASFKQPSANLAEALQSLKKPIKSTDVGARLLATFIGSSQAAVAALVGPCLGTFYGTNPATVLMRLSVAAKTASAVRADDPNPFVPAGCSSPELSFVVAGSSNRDDGNKPLLVTPLSRAGALCALASLVSAVAASVGDAGSLSEAQSAVVIAAAPIAIAACCDVSAVVRKAGVTLGKSLATLSKTLRFTVAFEQGDSLAPKSSSITSAQISFVGELLSGAGTAAAADPLSTPAVLGRKVFGDANGQKDLAAVLLWLATKSGWSLPHLATPIFTSSSAAPLQTTWSYLEYLLSLKSSPVSAVSIGIDGVAGIHPLSAALVQCVGSVSLSNSATQAAVAAWMCDCVGSYGSKDQSDVGKILGSVREEAVRLLSRGWTEGLQDQSVKNTMFSSLIKIQIENPGRSEILLALQGVTADLSTVSSLLRGGLREFFDSYNKSPGSAEEKQSTESAMEVVDETSGYAIDEEQGQLEGTGMSQPLLRFSSLLEALLSPMVTAVAIADKQTDGAAFGAMLAALLDSLRCLNDRHLRAVLSVEYSKTLVLDLADACVPVAAVTSEEPKAKKTPKKGSASAASAAASAELYSITRVQGDVEQVLISLGTAKSTQLQSSALNILRSLVALNPDSAAVSVSVLGRLLSSSTMGNHLAHYGENKRGIVGEVLKTLVGVIPASKGLLAQDILEPYCIHFATMPPRRRHVLTYMALNTLGLSALPACASTILAHTLAAYDPEGESSAKAAAAEDAVNNGGGLILLSRSSQRKAQRSLKTSLPEELFRLASECILSRPGHSQLGALITIIKSTHQLMEFAASGEYPAPIANDDDNDDDGSGSDDDDVAGIPGRVSVKIEGVPNMLLDTGKLQNYVESLVVARKSGKQQVQQQQQQQQVQQQSTDSEKRGSAAALLLLQLELVYEILENKSFHKNLVPLADSEDGAAELQAYCLELCEQVLQLLSSGSRAQASALADAAAGKSRKTSSSADELLTVRLGDSEIHVAIDGVGKNVWTWSLEILKSLQKLLDAPAFVAILQELLDHHDAGVRQTALQILAQRLQEMSEGARPGDEERALFTDLASHLREVVREALAPVQKALDPSSSKAKTPCKTPGTTPGKKSGKGSDSDSVLEDIDLTAVGIAQSALMCIDVLSRHLGTDPTTATMLTEMLGEVAAHAHLLTTATSSATVPSSAASSSSSSKEQGQEQTLTGSSLRNFAELVKLLGSSFLCSSTLCGSVGPRAIVVLPKLMGDILSSAEDHGASLLKEESDRAATLAVEESLGDDDQNDNDDDAITKRELARRKRLHTYIFGSAFAIRRARLLLLRSVVSAISVIITELPSFIHPFIQRTLIAVLKLRDIGDIGAKSSKAGTLAGPDDDATLLKKARPSQTPRRRSIIALRMSGQDLAADQAQSTHTADIQQLCGDIDRCLSVLATSIPPRLSVPVLLDSAPVIYKASHKMAARFAAVLGDVYDGLDRPTVVQHITALSSLATLSLDYRRAHGDQGSESNEVDRVVADGVVHLCLKFTETELKSFLGRLAEWRDIDTSSATAASAASADGGGNWRAHSRGASYYMLVSRLAVKLRSIFVPSMGAIWQNAADALTQLVQVLQSGSGSKDKDSGAELFFSSKKSKKRKSESGGSSSSSSDGNPDTRKTFVELTYRAEGIMDSVRTCCVNDDSDFLNEARYNTIMPAVADLLPIRSAFMNDASYLAFVENRVVPCLTALALDIGKDVLWKPMNHKILLSMRDSRSVVRIAALKALHKMFIEVGEDYLLLLPECLPFLSELLEDDDSDVAGLTGEVVRYIEELSGEKLDDYLS